MSPPNQNPYGPTGLKPPKKEDHIDNLRNNRDDRLKQEDLPESEETSLEDKVFDALLALLGMIPGGPEKEATVAQIAKKMSNFFDKKEDVERAKKKGNSEEIKKKKEEERNAFDELRNDEIMVLIALIQAETATFLQIMDVLKKRYHEQTEEEIQKEIDKVRKQMERKDNTRVRMQQLDHQLSRLLFKLNMKKATFINKGYKKHWWN